jgi:hypothetical protein
MADGRFREEQESGRTLLFDGTTQWRIGKGGRSVLTAASRMDPALATMIDSSSLTRDYEIEVTGAGEMEGRATILAIATVKSTVTSRLLKTDASELRLVIDKATGILLAKRSGPAVMDVSLSDVRVNEPVDESLLRNDSADPDKVIRVNANGSVHVPLKQWPRLLREIRKGDKPEE